MKKPKFTTFPIVKAPIQAEFFYKSRLVAMVKVLRDMIMEQLKPILKEHYSNTANDSIANDSDIAGKVKSSFDDIIKKSEVTYKPAEELSKSYVEKINSYNRSKIIKSVNTDKQDSSLFGRVDFLSMMDREGIKDAVSLAINENVGLIRSIPQQYLANIQKAVYANLTGNLGYKSLIDAINDCGHKETSRAQLIARDQTAKVNSSLDRIRSQNLGCVGYQWITSHDQRVRQAHKEHNNRYYLWENWKGKEKDRPIAPDGKPFNDPPVENGISVNPGIAIQCRCIAKSIIIWEAA